MFQKVQSSLNGQHESKNLATDPFLFNIILEVPKEKLQSRREVSKG